MTNLSAREKAFQPTIAAQCTRQCPSVGLTAFIIGLVGAILVISTNIGIGIFLIILALLGSGGMAYGVMAFLKWRYAKMHKKEHEPSKEPDNNK